MARVRTALIPKKSGAWRGIGIFAAFVRMYTRARVPWCKEWEANHPEPFFAQGSGRAPLDPIWRAAARAEAAAGSDAAAATVAIDVAAFFESIDWTVLSERAERAGFPAVLLRVALSMYGLPRHVEADGVATRPIWPTRGIAPGCPWAMCLAKVYVLEPMRRQTAAHPDVEHQIFVDDIMAGTEGPSKSVRDQVSAAAADLLELVPTALRSSVANDKIVIVASSNQLGRQLSSDLGLPESMAVRSTILLGGDYAAGRRRAAWAGRSGRRARISKTSRRRERVRILRAAAGARVKILAPTG